MYVIHVEYRYKTYIRHARIKHWNISQGMREFKGKEGKSGNHDQGGDNPRWPAIHPRYLSFEIWQKSFGGAAFPTWAHEKFPRVTIWKRQRDKYVRRDNAVAWHRLANLSLSLSLSVARGMFSSSRSFFRARERHNQFQSKIPALFSRRHGIFSLLWNTVYNGTAKRVKRKKKEGEARAYHRGPPSLPPPRAIREQKETLAEDVSPIAESKKCWELIE